MRRGTTWCGVEQHVKGDGVQRGEVYKSATC